jgi:hypothetical protein
MSNQVPFTAFCPDCNGHRTFTIIGRSYQSSRPDHIEVGCCVCGTSERDALVAVSGRTQDDRDTLGEIAARLNTLGGEVAELRDEVHALTVTRDGYRGQRPCADTAALISGSPVPPTATHMTSHAAYDRRERL